MRSVEGEVTEIMENSYRFFANRDCKYYPCHKDLPEMNCLFCYCPFFIADKCPGKPNYIRLENGKCIKDCSECTFPHKPENYDVIIKLLSKQAEREEG